MCVYDVPNGVIYFDSLTAQNKACVSGHSVDECNVDAVVCL